MKPQSLRQGSASICVRTAVPHHDVGVPCDVGTIGGQPQAFVRNRWSGRCNKSPVVMQAALQAHAGMSRWPAVRMLGLRLTNVSAAPLSAELDSA